MVTVSIVIMPDVASIVGSFAANETATITKTNKAMIAILLFIFYSS
jgi:hypothetical protein